MTTAFYLSLRYDLFGGSSSAAVGSIDRNEEAAVTDGDRRDRRTTTAIGGHRSW
ncbi:hypothetical protein Ae168Ps1_6166c [Pseudonocardia sp. Ae168_Ps1]|nr:hypothetical protein Ae168Ps1_6166c [Pseudonocardia sp. Ae168_Ps1]